MQALSAIKESQYFFIKNGDIQLVQKKEFKGEKIKELSKVLQLSPSLLNSGKKEDISIFFKKVELRYYHLKAKIDEQNFFKRILFYIVQYLKGVNIDRDFNRFKFQLYNKLNITQEEHWNTILTQPNYDSCIKLAIVKEICSDVPPLGSKLSIDNESLSNLSLGSELHITPSLEYRLLYLKKERMEIIYNRIIKSMNVGVELTSKDEKWIDQYMALSYRLSEITINEEFLHFKPLLHKALKTKKNGWLHPLTCEGWLKLSDKELKTRLCTHQSTYYFLGIDSFPTLYFDFRKQLHDLNKKDIEEKFYTPGTLQNNWRELNNSLFHLINKEMGGRYPGKACIVILR